MTTTADDFRPHVGIHLILIQNEKILLIQRANTGFADGDWSTPGGSLDKGETLREGAARESKEELGIILSPAGLTFVHLCHHADPDGLARIGTFFAATHWAGEPINAEPGKCSKIDWFDPEDLPGNTVSYIRTSIQAYRRGTTFSLDGW
jgi:8-oxo-dGTP pyrophosphatase MutT (NUDIX family)